MITDLRNDGNGHLLKKLIQSCECLLQVSRNVCKKSVCAVTHYLMCKPRGSGASVSPIGQEATCLTSLIT